MPMSIADFDLELANKHLRAQGREEGFRGLLIAGGHQISSGSVLDSIVAANALLANSKLALDFSPDVSVLFHADSDDISNAQITVCALRRDALIYFDVRTNPDFAFDCWGVKGWEAALILSKVIEWFLVLTEKNVRDKNADLLSAFVSRVKAHYDAYLSAQLSAAMVVE